MQKIFILTINGTIYVFNRDEINDNVILNLKTYAKKITEKNLEFKTSDETCEYFINQIEKELGIILQQVSVTDIIRININTN
mgnify:CR=1 FL=1